MRQLLYGFWRKLFPEKNAPTGYCQECKWRVEQYCHRFPPAISSQRWPLVQVNDGCGEYQYKVI